MFADVRQNWFKMPKKKSVYIPIALGASQEMLVGCVEKTQKFWILTIDISHKIEPSLNVTIHNNTVIVQGTFKNTECSCLTHFTQEHAIPKGYTWITRSAERGRTTVTAERKCVCPSIDDDSD
uniref:SHSP domain-containing protein n=1 Tax=Strigamia maritima TaxID=126957 RepID=T1J133_STRMM